MDELDLRAKFGDEAVLNRTWLAHLTCHGTSVGATVTPSETEEETLQSAWRVARSLADWLLIRAPLLPANERYEVIVGWSRTARQAQGQIFKTGGLASDLERIARSPTYESSALRSNWQKDVL